MAGAENEMGGESRQAGPNKLNLTNNLLMQSQKKSLFGGGGGTTEVAAGEVKLKQTLMSTSNDH